MSNPFPRNHNRLWCSDQERELVTCAHEFGNILTIANSMGRTTDSITSRMAKMLRLQYFTSNEELLEMFRKRFLRQPESKWIMSEFNNARNEQYITAKFRLCIDGHTKDVADSLADSDTKAKALVRANPTKEVVVFKAVKKYFAPMNVSSERIK